MAFESLTDRLAGVFKKLRGHGKLSEADIKAAMREVRMALLEADVNYKVAKDFCAKVSERAMGQEVMESLTPAQQVVKIVNEELVALMGGEEAPRLVIKNKGQTIIMLCGLQGNGKTTHAAKLAKYYIKQGRRPMLVACDIYRPAAIDQLQVVGKQAGAPVFTLPGEKPPAIAKKALAHAKDYGNDIIILDTAGRLQIDEVLMQELVQIKEAVPVDETLLVVDAMAGQDAVNVAKTFNETVGKEKGIIVEAYSQGSVNELEASVMQSAEGKIGAAAMPNIFSAYADTAYALDKLGLVVDVSRYLTADERAAYVDNYLTEGDFGQTGSIKIFPVAKSTELLFLNETDWQPFAEATGTQESEMLTIEGLLAVAERYYNWTDAQTATPDDGKALFGRDAMANYLLIGAQELGCTIFEVDGDGRLTLHFDRDIIRKLWDSYYVPFIKGYFSAAGRFRSDDIKTGNLLCYVGSSSSGTFFPSRVITSDTESHDITLKVLPCPKFADGESFAVQQGAGMVVTAGDEARVRASVEFLKWFTLPENNISFSVGSGYMPVTKAANNMDTIKAAGLTLSPVVEQVLTGAVATINENRLYTPLAFEGGQAARKVLEYALSDKAAADRAIVVERIAAGMSAEEAEAEFLTDECFDSWYQETLTKLQAYE